MLVSAIAGSSNPDISIVQVATLSLLAGGEHLTIKRVAELLGRSVSATSRLLDQLVKAARAKPNGRLEMPQRIKPGSELVRVWNRRAHRVVVLANGFAHEGKTYKSLSEIAFAITGTKWNGPRFFGLRRSSNDGMEDKNNAR